MPKKRSQPYTDPVKSLKESDLMKIDAKLRKREHHDRASGKYIDDATRETTHDEDHPLKKSEGPSKRQKTKSDNTTMNQ